MIKVMFVCLGNICRSPLAEAVFAQRLKEQNLRDKFWVESCGTAAYHIGEKPDPRTIAVAIRHEIPIKHSAQQLNKEDFTAFDYLLVMDDSNAENARKIEPVNATSLMYKLRDFDTENEGSDVADPWFGEEDGFETCYQTVDRCVDEFLHFLVKKHNLTSA
jgi:protein-tyrosine phosphatase